MKKNFFSLIMGEAIHIAPETKFIPAAEFSTLLEAKKILDKAKEDVEKYKLDTALECEKLKAQAERDGFNKGFEAWAEHIAKLEVEIPNVRSELEKAIIPVALKTAKKIVGREIERSDETIVDIVLNYLKAVSTHKQITIYVSKKDLNVLEANRPRLKNVFDSLEVLSIREKADMQPGDCSIETEGGIINARLDNQWALMEKAFAGMMQEPKEPVKQRK